jgi:hypothetical protein
MREALDKLISVRHYCFVLGILGRNPKGDSRDYHIPVGIDSQSPADDYKLAFRELNRAYVMVRDAQPCSTIVSVASPLLSRKYSTVLDRIAARRESARLRKERSRQRKNGVAGVCIIYDIEA